MNKLRIGTNIDIENEIPESGGSLTITDEWLDIPRSKKFDPNEHTIDLMRGMNEEKAEALADTLYATAPGGDNTLTVRNGRIALATALSQSKRLDDVKGSEEVNLMIESLLFTPLRKRVLTGKNAFRFSPHAKIQARLNRAELGEKTALIIGLCLMYHYPGQIVLPDAGFYLRDIHSALLREERLIFRVNFLDELPDDLRKSVMLIPDKKARGAIMEDAEELVKYERPYLAPNTDKYHTFIEDATG